MAMWSSKRWSPEAIAARKAAEAGVAYIPPPPPPPPVLLSPVPSDLVEEKWMAQLGSKRFYFTAKGLRAAEDRAASFFRVVRYVCEVTWLGPVSC